MRTVFRNLSPLPLVVLLGACSLDAPENSAPIATPPPTQEQQVPIPAPTDLEHRSLILLDLPQSDFVELPKALPLFHQLVKDDNTDAIEAYIAAGKTADLEAFNEDHQLPLHLARSTKMARLLWNRPVVVGYRRGGAILRPAYALRDREGLTPFHRMALEGRSEALKAGIQQWCSWWNSDLLNHRDLHGRTVLHLAALNGDANSVRLLLNCNWLDQKAVDSEGRTALHYAATHEDFSAGYLLMKSKIIDSSLKDKDGKIAFDFAKQSQSPLGQALLEL